MKNIIREGDIVIGSRIETEEKDIQREVYADDVKLDSSFEQQDDEGMEFISSLKGITSFLGITEI